jgi:GDP-D-mannose 3', 5'-epimerase
VDYIEEIAGIKLERTYQLDAPVGVAGRNSDNTFIQQVLKWEPNTPLKDGLKPTFDWIEQQYYARKAGERVVQD